MKVYFNNNLVYDANLHLNDIFMTLVCIDCVILMGFVNMKFGFSDPLSYIKKTSPVTKCSMLLLMSDS